MARKVQRQEHDDAYSYLHGPKSDTEQEIKPT